VLILLIRYNDEEGYFFGTDFLQLQFD